MPLQVTPWADPDPATGAGNPVKAKLLNLALYTSNGAGDHPNGIAFQAYRPILFEAKAAALTLLTSPAGTRSVLATSGTTASSFMVMDSAGYFGQTSDLPGKGYYQYTPVIAGSSGDGVSPGGWMIVCHFAAIAGQPTQTSVGADINENGTLSRSGTRFPASTSHDSTPFYLDLRNVGTGTWQPSVFVDDSSSTQTTLLASTTDPSGETSKFYAVWAGVASGGIGTESFTSAGTYNFTAPPGVTSLTVTSTGAGGGGGAGQGPYAGGGGGGGEAAQNTAVAVTPGSNYTAVVGAGGTAGVTPGGNGGAGGASTFAGDSQTVTGNGGSRGAGAGVSGDGSGGAGGTGSAAPTHHNGGTGAGGAHGKYGGGGGSSASPTMAGTAGTGASGGAAPSGGGNGGNGGTDTISVVQIASGSNQGGNRYTVSFAKPVQAGNAVLVAVNAVGTGDPGANGRVSSVILSDRVGPGGTQAGGVPIIFPGTALTARASAQVDGSPNPCYTYIWDVAGVSGGQTDVTITYGGSDSRRSLAYIYEVAGLGPAITADTSTTGANRGTFYTSGHVTTSDAPDFWIAVCGWQGTDPTSIYSAGPGWAQQKQISSGDLAGGNNIALRPGYTYRSKADDMVYSGNLSVDTGYAAVAVAYTTSVPTPGNAPFAGPGGGGGGGLGGYNGGAGADGSVTLTWAGQAGSAYGTPALPAPVSAWTDASEITAALLNGPSGVAGVCNFLNSPPLFSALATTAVSVPDSTVQALTQFGGSTDVDNYSGWNHASNTYTVQRDGLYLCHGLAAFTAQSGGSRLAGLKVNGTIYWGPGYPGGPAEHTHCSKTQVFGLHAGDTVQMVCWQNSGSSISLATADATRFFLAWLGELGAPAASWVPPDPGFRWQSGTAGADLPGLFQQYLANDLGFLCSRPYLLAYQSTAQSGLAASAFQTVTLDTAGNIVHGGDVGDNYSGWSAGVANNYTAPVAGWYLMCGEFFTTAPSSGSVVAGIAPSTSGGYAPSATPDWYQHMTASTTSSAPPGGTVFGLQYMQAGETITPQVNGQSYPAAFGTVAGGVTGGRVNSHLAVIWMSL